jgi:SPP1 family predicted phage head-tail adaptor
MNPGLLKHRVDIERPVTAQSNTGDPVVTWTLVARDVPASILPLSAKEFVAGLTLSSQVTTRIMIRYRADIDATMRLKHFVGNGVYELFNIAGILPDPRSGWEYLTLPVTRGVNEG